MTGTVCVSLSPSPVSCVELFLEVFARRARRARLVPLRDTWQQRNLSINEMTSSIWQMPFLCVSHTQTVGRVELFLQRLARRIGRARLVPLHDTFQRSNVRHPKD